MQLRLLCLLFCLFCTITSSFSQLEQLIDDPDIVWIAEFTTDYRFDPNAPHNTEQIKLTKYFNTPETSKDVGVGNFVIHQLFMDGLHGHTDCYADPGLTQLLSVDDIGKMITITDTVVTFDPATFEEQVLIVRNEMDLTSIEQLRVNQVIYFDKNTQDFETRIIAVAPLVNYSNDAQAQPLFWIKMDNPFPENFNIHASNIHFGALGYSHEHPLMLNFTEEIKNEGFDFKGMLLEQAQAIQKPVEAPERGFGSGNYYRKEDISHTHAGIDTITIFDPNTFEETVKIVKNEVNYSKIEAYRLVQEWYYDAKTHQFFNRLKAIAPLVSVKDDNGNFKFKKALYYIRYNSEMLKKS